MACGGCGKNRRPKNRYTSTPEKYDIAGGVAISSLSNRQIKARLEVFKRKFCLHCKVRYNCDYPIYLECKGANPR
jgi:hypothetical protein